MTIASEITRLQGAKSDIKTAIENKGVTVPSATKLDSYASLINSIPTGASDFYDVYDRGSSMSSISLYKSGYKVKKIIIHCDINSKSSASAQDYIGVGKTTNNWVGAVFNIGGYESLFGSSGNINYQRDSSNAVNLSSFGNQSYSGKTNHFKMEFTNTSRSYVYGTKSGNGTFASTYNTFVTEMFNGSNIVTKATDYGGSTITNLSYIVEYEKL